MYNTKVAYYYCHYRRRVLPGARFKRPIIVFVPRVQWRFCRRKNINNVVLYPESPSTTVSKFWYTNNAYESDKLCLIRVLARKQMTENLPHNRYRQLILLYRLLSLQLYRLPLPPLYQVSLNIRKTEVYYSLITSEFETVTLKYKSV